MKKLIFSLFAIVAMFVLASCGGYDNTPTGITKAYYDAMLDEDYDKVFDCMVNKKGEKFTKEEREQLNNMIASKADDPNFKHNATTDYEILEEVIDANNEDKAKVTVKVTKSDGKVKNETVKCLKVEDKWYVILKK